MESSLSTHQYKLKLPETSFTASGHRVHVMLEFKPQVCIDIFVMVDNKIKGLYGLLLID